VAIAIVVALTETKSVRDVWSHCYIWSFPYYLAGAGIVAVFGFASPTFDWHAGILVLPVLYLLYRSYTSNVNQLQTGSKQNQAKPNAREIATPQKIDANARLDAVFC